MLCTALYICTSSEGEWYNRYRHHLASPQQLGRRCSLSVRNSQPALSSSNTEESENNQCSLSSPRRTCYTSTNRRSCSVVFMASKWVIYITRRPRTGTPFEIAETTLLPRSTTNLGDSFPPMQTSSLLPFHKRAHVDDNYKYPASRVPSDSSTTLKVIRWPFG